jgi:hypothetical protein
MSQTLQPVITQAKTTIAKADAPAFLTGLFALTQLPEGKTGDQLQTYTVRPNKATGEINIDVQFTP